MTGGTITPPGGKLQVSDQSWHTILSASRGKQLTKSAHGLSCSTRVV